MLKTQTTRRLERVPFFVEVIVAPLNGGTMTPARSFDISLAGVGLVCSKPIPVGQSVCLTFYITTGKGVVAEGPVLGRVARIHHDYDDSVMGLEFERILDRRQVPTLVEAVERL